MPARERSCLLRLFLFFLVHTNFLVLTRSGVNSDLVVAPHACGNNPLKAAHPMLRCSLRLRGGIDSPKTPTVKRSRRLQGHSPEMKDVSPSLLSARKSKTPRSRIPLKSREGSEHETSARDVKQETSTRARSIVLSQRAYDHVLQRVRDGKVATVKGQRGSRQRVVWKDQKLVTESGVKVVRSQEDDWDMSDTSSDLSIRDGREEVKEEEEEKEEEVMIGPACPPKLGRRGSVRGESNFSASHTQEVEVSDDIQEESRSETLPKRRRLDTKGREKEKKKVKERKLTSSKLSKQPSRGLKQSSNKEIFRFPSHSNLLVGPWLIQMYQSSATLFLGLEISSRDVEDVKTLKPVTLPPSPIVAPVLIYDEDSVGPEHVNQSYSKGISRLFENKTIEGVLWQKREKGELQCVLRGMENGPEKRGREGILMSYGRIYLKMTWQEEDLPSLTGRIGADYFESILDKEARQPWRPLNLPPTKSIKWNKLNNTRALLHDKSTSSPKLLPANETTVEEVQTRKGDLLVIGLSKKVKKRHLAKTFSPFGPIRYIRIIRSKRRVEKRVPKINDFAIVEFEWDESASFAMTMNGKMIKGDKVMLQIAKRSMGSSSSSSSSSSEVLEHYPTLCISGIDEKAKKAAVLKALNMSKSQAKIEKSERK
ncbi:hypothetical protein GUITHDRAFT_116642 [Guillardia theta CCMP2712]|uniref:RRM domain-containing protein n=1 Tax=Guillardia theta (strain CCMP2712) TaxID=905079 RepID=L1IM92_GUITC|nr:hypothetical protein GUITHDRAFT_116642 [Guillardia theta CCMP2712]EKX37227.1 hypothetical protein GUITHDRAFT_116642 [Guillardia theta CCMP2712]|eukprot:XP_005824207.1 hypothetical protein GUITHDRAFT_116642 [Guillardia theta CCMP2712]